MTFTSDEYGKRTLEFVAKVSVAHDADAVRALTRKELEWYGLDFVTSWSLPELVEDFSDTVTMNTRPQGYVDHYERSGLAAIDPVVTTMRSTMSTLAWSDVRRRDLTRNERFIIDEARDFGASDGLTIPVHSKDGWIGVFSPCGLHPDLSERARAALEVVGIYAHQTLERLASKDGKSRKATKPLTPREREIMRWVALGKTNEEIGVILGVGRTTIKTMLARAQDKLNATRRTYAVVQAIRLGELDLNF